MKKAVCISCTHHYRERIEPVENALRKAGYDCSYITSDFHHINKKRHKVDMPHCVQIPTLPYGKNISLQRILSHLRFAKAAMQEAERLQPDLLYVEIPPNSLCREAARYKKKHPETKVILDVFDMWPESFPGGRIKKVLALPFKVWGWFRNWGLPRADVVLTECDLFGNLLQKYMGGKESHTLYLCRPGATTDAPKAISQQEGVQLCYLGSINNIIDIPAISSLIGAIQQHKSVTLHIIGDGESRDAFISAVEAVGAKVEFHGKVYDNAQKQAIFDQCSFGLNIMKSSVCIGLTMKSVDYFAGGLPIINTIGGDTQALVQTRNMGVNLLRDDPEETARQILACTDTELLEMRKNTLSAFHELFCEDVFRQTLMKFL